METRGRGMRKVKEKVSVQLPKLTEKKAAAKTQRVKRRAPLQAMSGNINTAEFKLTKCSVRVRKLSPKSLESPLRRLSQAENIYDFEESPSQTEVVEPNDELKEILKTLEKKNIVKVAKHKPLKENRSAAVALKGTKSKKRKTTPVKPAPVKKKKIAHNLDAEQGKIGATNVVADNNADDCCSVNSVCSDIVDHKGDTIGLIEKEWSKEATRSFRKRKLNSDDVMTAKNAKVNNNKVVVADMIEVFVEKAIEAPVELPVDDSIPFDDEMSLDDNWKPEEEIADHDDALPSAPLKHSTRKADKSLQPPQPAKRVLNGAIRNRPTQSTPKTTRPKLDATEIFRNASPLMQAKTAVDTSKPPNLSEINAPEYDVLTVNDSEQSSHIEKNNHEIFAAVKSPQPRRVYGRSPLKNISNITSSTLFEQQKNTNENSTALEPPFKNAVRSLERPIAEIKPPQLNELFGFDDDNGEDENTSEVSAVAVVAGGKNALIEKRDSLKRFLKNSNPKAAKKASPKKQKSPVKSGKPAVIFVGEKNAQKDIRSALQSHKNSEPVDEGANLFSDTETELLQDRRKSYARKLKQHRRPLVEDSEHEEDEEDVNVEPEKTAKKSKKRKDKPAKKAGDPKEKSADDDELDRFAKEFNSLCAEVDRFEVRIENE